jgi:hypothetical protein
MHPARRKGLLTLRKSGPMPKPHGRRGFVKFEELGESGIQVA